MSVQNYLMAIRQFGNAGQHSDYAALEARCKDLLAALEAVEWSYRYGGGDRCPRCCRFDHEGHAPECIIGNAIKKARGEA